MAVIVTLASVTASGQNGENMRSMIEMAMKRPIDPWHNPEIEQLETRLLADPDQAAQVLSDIIGALDVEDTVQLGKAKRGVRLLALVRSESALRVLGALHSNWKGSSKTRALARQALVQALSVNPLNPVGDTFARQRPRETMSLLERWLQTEEDPDVLELGLRALFEHVPKLSDELLQHLEGKVSASLLETAKRYAQLNAIKDPSARFRQALVWLDEIIAGMKRGEAALSGGDGSETRVFEFLCRKLRDDKTLLKRHLDQLRRRSDVCRRLGRKLAQDRKSNNSTQRAAQIMLLSERVTKLRRYLLLTLRMGGARLSEEEIQTLDLP